VVKCAEFFGLDATSIADELFEHDGRLIELTIGEQRICQQSLNGPVFRSKCKGAVDRLDRLLRLAALQEHVSALDERVELVIFAVHESGLIDLEMGDLQRVTGLLIEVAKHVDDRRMAGVVGQQFFKRCDGIERTADLL